jgi:hypothetical protein
MDKCSVIDRQIGRMVKALEERGFLDDTVIIFTSDHGDNLGDYGIWDKRFFYEQSVGVPLVMAGPGVPRQERLNGVRLSKALVTHLDLFPTILELAGVSADGESAGMTDIGKVAGVSVGGGVSGSKDQVGTSAGEDASVVSAKSDLAGNSEGWEPSIASAVGGAAPERGVADQTLRPPGNESPLPDHNLQPAGEHLQRRSASEIESESSQCLVGHNLRRIGSSLLGVLRDEYTGGPGGFHDAVYAELATSAMIRTASWKLVFDPEQGGVTHLYNLTVDHHECENLAGRAGYETITAQLIEKLLAHRIVTTQYTHQKEEKRLQRIRAGL